MPAPSQPDRAKNRDHRLRPAANPPCAAWPKGSRWACMDALCLGSTRSTAVISQPQLNPPQLWKPGWGPPKARHEVPPERGTEMQVRGGNPVKSTRL